MADVVRSSNARLKGAPHPLHKGRIAPGPLRHLRRNYAAYQAFDEAHTVALLGSGLIDRGVATSILTGLRRMQEEGLEDARDRQGGGRHAGESYLTERLGSDVAGWINLARSSGDLDAVAWKFTLRHRMPGLLTRLIELRGALIERAAQHVDTLMPGMSLGQYAQCTTLGHTLLSWEAPFARDCGRLAANFHDMGSSPAGSCIMTGSSFPIARERVAALLGFSSVDANTRDAVMNIDVLLDVHSTAAIAMSNAMNVANDLYLWSTNPFRFVELDDQYCGTSSIMPQKKNPLSLSWIRGQSSVVNGRMSALFAMRKTETGALEDAIMGPWHLYDTLDDLEDALDLLSGIVRTLRVDRGRMASEAEGGWLQATDLAAALTEHCGLSWREAHHTVAALVRRQAASGGAGRSVSAEDVAEASADAVGRRVEMPRSVIDRCLDAGQSIAARDRVDGSPGPAQMERQLRTVTERLEDDRSAVDDLGRRLGDAAALLDAEVDRIIAAAGEHPGA